MFKKTLAAIAVGMVVVGAQAAEFKAGDVTFQVNLDAQAEAVSTKATVGSSTTFVGKGQIQLKATKNVNNDLSVFGQVEVDFDPVIDNDTVKSDDVKIGLASKSFGTLTLGQFDTYMEDNIAEALGYYGSADAGAVFVNEATVGNDARQLQYVVKSGDFVGAFSVNSSNAVSNAGEQFLGSAIVLGYSAQGLRAYIGYSDLPKHKTDFGLNTVDTAIGASLYYTFGTTTVSALSINETSTANLITNYAGLGIHHVMGDFDIGGSFQTKSAPTATTSQYHLHGGYTVTKGTKFYVAIGSLGAADGVGDGIAVGLTTSF